jgi:hypothetical protein
MATSRPRKNLSSTTSKSSGNTTESPRSGSTPSEPEYDETSTPKETNSSDSSQSDEDFNESLFAEADSAETTEEKDPLGAPQVRVSMFQPSTEGNEVSAYETAKAVSGGKVEGDVQTFEKDGATFQAIVEQNYLVVTEDSYREVGLPGTERKGTVLAYHKGQVLPVTPYEQYAKKD